MKRTKRIICMLLCVLTLLSGTALALSDAALSDAVSGTAEYICKTVTEPSLSSVGGEWAVLGLARSGYAVPDGYFRRYYSAVEEYVEACSGVLSGNKYTEYSRVIIALSAIGADAENVAGYDLIRPLGDYDKTVRQGINGPIFALIALDSRDYPMPENSDAKTQASRQMYIDYILSRQLPGGGWSLSPTDTEADADVTGMALCALAGYRQLPEVSKAVNAALSRMSLQQTKTGGFASHGVENAESCAQMITALCELGIPLTDTRFVKNGSTVLDCLMTYRTENGGFCHVQGGAVNQMSTEQALYALAAAKRQTDGQNALYDLSDAQSMLSGKSGTDAMKYVPAAIAFSLLIFAKAV